MALTSSTGDFWDQDFQLSLVNFRPRQSKSIRNEVRCTESTRNDLSLCWLYVHGMEIVPLYQCVKFGSRETNQSESGSWSYFAITKSWILTWKIYFMKGYSHKTYHTHVKKHFERLEIRFVVVNIGKYFCSWIRIHIPNMDPDPGETNQCGFGSKTLPYTSLKCKSTSNDEYLCQFVTITNLDTLFHGSTGWQR